jgi:hypothetical protein
MHPSILVNLDMFWLYHGSWQPSSTGRSQKDSQASVTACSIASTGRGLAPGANDATRRNAAGGNSGIAVTRPWRPLPDVGVVVAYNWDVLLLSF